MGPESYHMHNEHKKADSIINKISEGNTIALISDAGTPSISDPGFLLVRECIKNNIEAECLPGATALITALVISGINKVYNSLVDAFIFFWKPR